MSDEGRLNLEQHDARSYERAEDIKEAIYTHKKGEGKMTPGMNIFNESADVGGGGGFGHGGMGGLGSGFVGGIVGGALLGRRGLLGGGGDDNGAETRIQDNVFNTAVL